MKFKETLAVLPCQSLEDLSLNRPSDDANELLTAWSVLYHPAILAKLDRMPSWARAIDPPRDMDGRIFTLPSCCRDRRG